MSKQSVSGSLENLKGRVKQAAGAVTGDKSLEAEGAVDRAKGAVKEALGKAKDKLDEGDEDEAVDEVDVERGAKDEQ
jgi:uncharacterized protein YjbJ (UPF0337 family)